MLGGQTLITGLKKVFQNKLLYTAELVKILFEFDCFFKLQHIVKS